MKFGDINKNIYIFVISIVVVAMLIILQVLGALNPIKSYFKVVLEPVQSFFYDTGQGITGFFGLITSVRDLEEENKELSRKVEDLYVKKARTQELENENEILREQLEYKDSSKEELITAFVTNKDPSNFFVSFGIDKGSKDGIEPGMPVVVADGILVGQIYEVDNYSATVLLTVDTRSQVNAKILSSDATGIVGGEHNLAVTMELIPQNKEINVGDLVVTSGLGEQFPEGLVIGEVESIYNSDNALFQSARIKSLANFQDLRMVFVIDKE